MALAETSSPLWTGGAGKEQNVLRNCAQDLRRHLVGEKQIPYPLVIFIGFSGRPTVGVDHIRIGDS